MFINKKDLITIMSQLNFLFNDADRVRNTLSRIDNRIIIIDKELKNLNIKSVKTDEKERAMWNHTEENGKKYSTCNRCKKRVQRQDAGRYCTFCGSIMKNPVRE